jgi:RNA polymerase sigma-70 factor, ECF subfamily
VGAEVRDIAESVDWSRQVKVHRKYLLSVARTLLSDVASADDVVQETLLTALHATARFEQRASLRTWLTVILKRKVLDLLRAAHRVPVPLSKLSSADQAGDALGQFDEHGTWLKGPSFWDQPEQALAQGDFMRVFESCLHKLPRPVARAFVLRAILDADTDEVTSSLGISANHLGVTLYRARMALRECLSIHWFASEYASCKQD